MNIHDKARALVAQSHHFITLSEAYSKLSKRARRFRRPLLRSLVSEEKPRYAWQNRADCGDAL